MVHSLSVVVYYDHHFHLRIDLYINLSEYEVVVSLAWWIRASASNAGSHSVLLGAWHERGEVVWREEAYKFSCCALGTGIILDSFSFIWLRGSGASHQPITVAKPC